MQDLPLFILDETLARSNTGSACIEEESDAAAREGTGIDEDGDIGDRGTTSIATMSTMTTSCFLGEVSLVLDQGNLDSQDADVEVYHIRCSSLSA